MCSSPNSTEVALQQSQAAFTNTLNASFKTAFAANQAILGRLSGVLTSMIANPIGFTPAMMVALRTGATDTVAGQTANAEKAAAAYGAAHGGADLGSGVQAQIQGTIATGGAETLAGEQNQITIANAQQQQANYWNAINGLTQVGAAYNPTGYANAETNSANATTNASNAILSEEQAGWQNAFGVMSGVAGLGMSGVGAFNALENPATQSFSSLYAPGSSSSGGPGGGGV